MDVWGSKIFKFVCSKTLVAVDQRNATCPQASGAPQERTDGGGKDRREGPMASNQGRERRYKARKAERQARKGGWVRLKEVEMLGWQQLVQDFGGVSVLARHGYGVVVRTDWVLSTSLDPFTAALSSLLQPCLFLTTHCDQWHFSIHSMPPW